MKKHVLLGATVALLLDVSLAHALPANQSLHIDSGRLSATLAGAPLGEIATEVRKAGIPVTFTEPALAARQIHVDLKDVAIEEGLRRILRDNYVMAFRRVNGESVLASVIIGDRSKMGDTKSKVKTIAYGNGKGQVGVLRGGAGAHAGPASFFADAQGRRLICDSVNGRILVLDTNGEEVSAFSLKDFKADDVMSDASGNIFVFDVSGRIRQFDSTGLEIAQASVGDQSWLTRGPMRIVGDGVYVRVDGQSDRRVANLVDGRMQTLPEGLNAVSEAGQLGTSGRAYLADLASQVGLSQAQLSKRFQSETGLALRRFRLWNRLFVTACYMQVGRSLTDASVSAGFSDSAHFAHTFKEMIGVRPSCVLKAVDRLCIFMGDDVDLPDLSS